MEPPSFRGQSEVLGVVLLFGLTIVSVSAVVILGSVALDDTRSTADIEMASQSMTQFASQTSLVAHGESGQQQISLPSDRGFRSIDEDAGTLYVESTDSDFDSISVDLGTLTYEDDGDTVAYQGGGVWKMQGGNPTMVSPPEFHYRVEQGGTPALTLPLVTLRGEAVDSDLQISRSGETQALVENPQIEGDTTVTVNSEYYIAWGKFFEDRTTSEVSYDHDENNVSVTLKVPEEGGDAPAPIVGDGDGIDLGGGDGMLDGYSDGEHEHYPSDYPDEEASIRVEGDLDDDNGFEVHGDVHVTGEGDFANDVTVTGDTYINGDVFINNNPDIKGSLHAGGDFVLDANIEIGGEVIVGGTIDELDTNEAIEGSVHVGEDVEIADWRAESIEGDLVIGGDLTGGEPHNGFDVDGEIYVRDELTLEGLELDTNVVSGDDAIVLDESDLGTGTLHSNAEVTVSDDFESDIEAEGDVTVEENQRVDGDIITNGNVVVEGDGVVDGTIRAGGDIEISDDNPPADVTGDAYAGGSIDDPGNNINGATSEDDDDSPADPEEPLSPSNPTAAEVDVPEAVDTDIDDLGVELEDDDDNDNDDTDCIQSENLAMNAGGCDQTLEAGDYYLQEMDVDESLTLDTDNGPIRIYVEERVTINEELEVTGDDRAEIYIGGDAVGTNQLEINEQVSGPGQYADMMWIYLKGDASAHLEHNDPDSIFQGVIFGPGGASDGVEIELDNNAKVLGALVGDIQESQNLVVHYDQELSDASAVGGDGLEDPEIAFLHISQTEVEVD